MNAPPTAAKGVAIPVTLGGTGADPDGQQWVNKKVLILDDFASMRQMLRDTLRNFGVKYIEQASNGAEALSQMSRTTFDVVLCDFHLGDGMNGHQVLVEARLRNLITPSCIWLVVSVEKSSEMIMGLAEHQADGYVIKPITEAILLTRLKRILQKKQVFAPIQEALAANDFHNAMLLCDKALRQHKVHVAELLRLKTDILRKSGADDKALDIFGAILREREFPWAKTGIAQIHLANGEIGEARDLLLEVVTETPTFLEAFDSLADAHLKLGEDEEAKSALMSATKLSPNSAERQMHLGDVALKLGDTEVAEKAYRKSVNVGEYSISKKAGPYFGLAKLVGIRGETKEALGLLKQVQQLFPTQENLLRAKVTEATVLLEGKDRLAARRAGQELYELLERSSVRLDVNGYLDTARMLFAIGARDEACDLIGDVVINNHDNAVLLEECQAIFDKANMHPEGAEIIADTKQEALEMMNRGLLLWKAGNLEEAVEWMRASRPKLPENVRFLLNFAGLLIAYSRQFPGEEECLEEARSVLGQVHKKSPNHPRYAEMMALLA